MRVGVLLPNWIGDVVMATPFLRALNNKFGSTATITGIMRPYVSDVLAGTPWLDDVVHYDPKSKDRNLHTHAVARRLGERDLDWFFLLPNSIRAAALAWLSGARKRVGYVRYGRGPFLSHKLDVSRNRGQLQPISAVDYYLQLAYAAGCFHEPRNVELGTCNEDERHAHRVWHRLGLHKESRVVVLNTGGFYGSSKNWPVDYFVELANRLTDENDCAVLVVCGPSERLTADEIEWRAKRSRVTSLAKEDLSIGLTKACIRRSQLVVTTDSGPRHFAAAFSVPAVTIFGPTDPRWSFNYHLQETPLKQSLPCAPCGKRICPLIHHRCMRDVTVDHVLAAALELLPMITPAQAA